MNTLLILLKAATPCACGALTNDMACANSKDVTIVAIVCCTVFLVVSVLTCGYFNWKEHECNAKKNAAERLHKHENEVAETKHKIEMEKEMLDYLKKLSEIKYKDGESKVEVFKAAYKDFISKLEFYLGLYTKKNPE